MKRDILSDRSTTAIVYWLPILALVVSGALSIGNGYRVAIWVVALTTMGTGCVINAFRCGRMHCYFTGPFFLIMAVLTLLYGLGIVPLGPHGWSSLSLTLLIGGLLLCFLPEPLLGRYRE